MKKCIICNKDKVLNDFYTHSKMKDGRINKCKECCKEQQKYRQRELRKDPVWIEKERKRGRDKAMRLYRNKRPSKKSKKEAIIRYNLKYPEKLAAKKFAGDIPIRKGYHRHHWSYLPEHYFDYIEIKSQNHYIIHRYLKYNDNEYMYMTKEDVLLDSKQSHIDYINKIIKDNKS